MIRRNMAILFLTSTILLSGCGKSGNNNTDDMNNSQNNTTNQITDTNNNANNTANNKDSEHITENVIITNPDEALNRLKEGNKRFLENSSDLINISSERREQLANGQNPYAIVVSCSDSRVTPELIFNTGLGELFNIRLAGNVVDNDALGSIEYGVEHLNSPLIVIMGHQNCGAVTAAYDQLTKGTDVTGSLSGLVDKIEANIKDSDSLDDAIHENIDKVADVVEDNQIVKHLIESGKVKIVKAYYSLDGKVTFED